VALWWGADVVDDIALEARLALQLTEELKDHGNAAASFAEQSAAADPAKDQKAVLAAADQYKIPWTLLAGIGMEETGHGRNNHTSSRRARADAIHARATWPTVGVDQQSDQPAHKRSTIEASNRRRLTQPGRSGTTTRYCSARRATTGAHIAPPHSMRRAAGRAAQRYRPRTRGANSCYHQKPGSLIDAAKHPVACKRRGHDQIVAGRQLVCIARIRHFCHLKAW
jgi:hypothetical protein